MVNGNVTDVMAEDIFVDTVVDIINQCKVPENSYAMLSDQNFGVLAHPNEEYGYIDDKPVMIGKLEGNPYKNIGTMLQSGKAVEVSIKDYGLAKGYLQSSTPANRHWLPGKAHKLTVFINPCLKKV